MPLGRAVKGADPHQTVHTAFRLQPAIGIVPGDLVGGRFDPGLFARALGLQLDLVALLFRPTHVHARQHAGPVTAFRAPGARVDFQKRVIAVGFAVQQRFKFLLRGPYAEGLDGGLRLCDDLFVLFHLAQFDQLDIVR